MKKSLALSSIVSALALILATTAFGKDAAMSQEQQNQQVFKKVLDRALNGRELAVFDEVLGAGHVDHDLPPGTPPGPGGTKAKLGAFLAAFPDIRFTFENEVYQGDKLAGRGYFTGTHLGAFNGIPPTGKQVKVTFMDLWRFENGKVVEYWGAPDRLSLMTQLGVIPAPRN